MVKEAGPTFVQKPALDQSDDGRILTFTCKIAGNPQPKFTWFLDDKAIKDGGRYFTSVKPDKDLFIVRMEIEDIAAGDAGNYKIVAENKLGTTSATIALKFGDEETEMEQEAGPGKDGGRGTPPNFTMKPRMRQSDDGTKLTIECELQADPAPTIEWLRGTQLLKDGGPGGHLKLRETNDGDFLFLTLEINDVSEEDGGDYKIIAKNKLGTATNTIKLNFEKPGGAPRFTMAPKIKQLPDGTITFTCELSADPKPTFTWLKDGKPVKAGGRVKIEVKQDGEFYALNLDIIDAGDPDAGKYEIQAKNKFGEASSTITLNFEGEQQEQQQKQVSGTKPVFLTRPSMRQSDNGHKLTFECQVQADPEPQVMWTHGNVIIKDGGRYKITKTAEGTKYSLSLTIDKVSPTDGGTYVVYAQNQAGDEHSTINLNFDIKDASKEGAPTFIEKPNIKQEDQGRRVVFEIKLMGDPKPNIMWYYNDKELKDDRKYRMKTQPKGKVYILSLEVSNASNTDSGNYLVVAENDKGKATSTINLKFEQAPGPKFGPKKFNIVPEVEPSMQIDFGAPLIELDIGSLGKSIQFGDVMDREIEIVSQGPEDVTPTIEAASQKPVIVEELKDQDVEDGSKVVLRCRISGNPTRVIWYRDGKEIKSSQEFKMSHEGDVYILEILEVLPEDTGDYSVVASSDAGEAKSIAEVFVEDSLAPGKKTRPAKQPAEEPISVFTEQGVEAVPIIPFESEDTEAEIKGLDFTYAEPSDEKPSEKPAEEEGVKKKKKEKEPVDLSPYFVESPSKCQSPEGQTVKFEAVVSGEPKPLVTWYKGTKPIEDGFKNKYGVRYNEKSDVHILEIKRADQTDSGKFSCKLQNEHGKDERVFSLMVTPKPQTDELDFRAMLKHREFERRESKAIEPDWGDLKETPGLKPKPVQIIMPLKDVKVNEKDGRMKLICEAKFEGSSPKWYKDGKELAPSKKCRMKTKPGEAELVVFDIAPGDKGEYKVGFPDGTESKCKVSIDTHVCLANISEPEYRKMQKQGLQPTDASKPKMDFVTLIKTQEVDEGTDAKYTAELSGDKFDVSWHKDGKKITAKDIPKFEIKKLGRKHTLVVKKVTAEDEGEVVLKVDRRECIAGLLVKAKPKFTKELADITIVEKRFGVLECEISDWSAKTEWQKDGKLFPGNERAKPDADQGVRRIIFDKVTFDDAGKYTLKFGKLESSAAVKIIEAPSMTAKLDPVSEVFVGDNAELITQVSTPEAEVYWFKDNEPLEPSDKFEVIEDGNTRKLVVHDAQPEDQGRYACAMDEDNATYSSLKIQETPSLNLDTLKDVTVKAGEPVELTCEISGSPAPTVQWTKGTEVISETARIQIVTTPNDATILITKAERADTFAYTINVGNKHGDKKATVNVKVIDFPEAPASIKVTAYSETTVSITWEPPKYDGNMPITHYYVEKREKRANDWEEADSKVRETQYTVTGLTENKEYFFRVSAINEVGSSSPTQTDKPQIVKEPSEPPDKPGAPKVVATANGSISLQWSPPEFDGGRPITGYLMEKRDTSNSRWSKASKESVTETKMIVTGLIQGTEYQFRVSAMNKVGTSEPSEPSKAALAREPIDPATAPGQPKVGDVTKNSVPLEWSKPADDGGSPIKGYHVEKKNPDSGKWDKVNKSPIKGNKYTVPDLVEGEEYDFRVSAENEAGMSEPSETTGPVVAKDPEIPPTLDLKNMKDITVKAGQTFKLHLKYSGTPHPTAKWSNPDKDLQTDERVKVRSTPVESELSTWGTTRADSGSYTVTVSNPFGTETATAKVTVIGKPGMPKAPLEAKDVVAESLTLTWSPPDDDGGLPLSNYVIEKRDVQRSGWSVINDTTKDTQVKVTRLLPGTEYMFRVAAENSEGTSKWLDTSRSIIAKNPYDEACAPGKPEIVDFDRDFVELEWDAPKDDGGAPIDGYVIEKRDKGSPRWQEVTPSPVKGTHHKVDNLPAGRELEFRVAAVNKAGVGKPSECSNPQKMKPKFARPTLKGDKLRDIKLKAGQDFTLEVAFEGAPPPTITWTLNGSRVQPSDRMTIKDTEESSELKVRFSERHDGGTYELKLSNDSGDVKTSCNVNVQDRPSAPQGPLEVSDVFAENCQLSWKPPADDGGSDIINYLVEKCEVRDDFWSKVTGFCQEPHCQANKLQKGTSYKFRVRAENASGFTSEPLESAEPVLAKNPYEAPAPPGQPRIPTYDRDHADLEWEVPSSDGGSKIVGYTVERREVRSQRWVKVTREPIRDTAFTVTGLTEGREYLFRVFAENKGGMSEPSPESEHFVAKPQFEAPRVDSSGFGLHDMRVKAGDNFEIKVPFVGAPAPTATWMKDNRDLKPSSNVTVDTTETISVFKNSCAERGDTGSYKITLDNSRGTDSFSLQVTVLDKPTAPNGPIEYSDFAKESVRLSWSPPDDDGNGTISGYVVERRDAKRDNWTRVTASAPTTSYTVKDLIYTNDYVFHVCAVNQYGVSEPLEGRQVKIKLTFDEPDAPTQPKVESMDRTSAQTSWQPPEYDGGSPVTGYYVDYRQTDLKEWQRANSFPVRDTRFNVQSLKEGREYQFRFIAENEAGEGKPSRVTEPQVAKEPIYPADSPGRPNLDKVTKDSAAISWSKPMGDGGAPIKGYTVEKRKVGPGPKGDWEPAMELSPKDNSAVVPDLTEGDELEFRVRANNDAGPGKPSAPTPSTIIEDKPERPKLDLGKVEDIKVKGGEQFEINLPFTGVPTPEVTWELGTSAVKEDGRVLVKTTKTYTKLLVESAQRSDAGRYSITLKNASGSDSGRVKVTVLAEPDAPQGPLRVSDVTPDQASLSWKPPTAGPEDVENYVVEKLDPDAGTWSKVSSFVPAPHFKVRNLKPGGEYQFRVSAENKYGTSKPILSEPVIAKNPFDPPSAPSAPEAKDTTSTSISIEWKPPTSDGGNPITGYIVEKREERSDKWTTASRAPVKDTSFTVFKLTEGTAYEFQVKAVNEAGPGKPSDSSDAITARPEPIKPKIDSQARNREITAVAGEQFRVELPFEASPTPQVTWTRSDKNGITVEPSHRITFDDSEFSSIMINSCAERTDAGTYAVTLRNEKGTDTGTVRIIVVDKPSAPEAPLEATDVTADFCRLSWKPPRDDGGSRVTNYVVEKQEAGRSSWTKVSTFVRTTSYDVVNLEEGSVYKFRVSAENQYGVGEPLEGSRPITIKNPFDVADAPGKPVAEEVDRGYVRLSWTAPESDGGAPITGYVVQKKDRDSDWIQCNDYPVKDTTMSLSNLRDTQQYEFRVIAKNKAGNSPPSRPLIGVEPKPQYTTPDAPGAPVAANVGKDSVDLEWEKPPSDGGAKLSGYTVEKRTPDSPDWVKANRYPIRGTSCTVDGLEPGQDYEFRVTAENEAGPSEPAVIAQPVQTQEAVKGRAPFFEKRIVNTTGAAGEETKFEASVSGAPQPEVRWIRNGEELFPGARVRTRQTEETYILTLVDLRESDGGDIVCEASNKSGTERCRAKLVIMLPPSIMSPPRDVAVEAGNPFKVKIPFTGKGDIKVGVFRGLEPITDESRVKSIVFDDYVQVSIKEAYPEDNGTFKISLGNDVGQDSTSFGVKVTDRPSAPRGPLEIGEVTNHSIALAWKPPANDGGSPVKSYTVERKDDDNPDWITIGNYIKSPAYVAINLRKGVSYEFRVFAENDVGTSPPLTGKEPIVAKAPYDPPGKTDSPDIVDVGKDFVSLSWSRPSDDGGCAITGYNIQKTEAGIDRWSQVNSNPTPQTQFFVPNLVEDREYEFRIVAVNKAGAGEPSMSSLAVRVKDPNPVTRPKFEEGLKDTVAVQGRTARFSCSFSGIPTPDIRWMRGQRELFNSQKFEIDSSDNSSTLTVTNVAPDDEDEFIAEISNPGGKKYSRGNLTLKTPPTVRVPLRYQGATVTYAKGESIRIKVSYSGRPQAEGSWQKNGKSISRGIESGDRYSILNVENTDRSHSGKYTIIAENEVGTDSADIDICITDAPGQVTELRAVDISHETVELTWSKPEDDGGYAQLTYVIDRSEDGASWSRCGSASTTVCMVHFLSPNRQYTFRVMAENIYGRGEPTEISHTITKAGPEKLFQKRFIEEEEAPPRPKVPRVSDYDTCVDDSFTPVNVKVRRGNVEDKYNIGEEIGRGPFGVVYRCVERGTGRTFAAKFMDVEPKDKVFIKQEIETMGQLQHPRLQQVHDAFDMDDKMVLVMDFLSGGDAFQRARDRGTLSEEIVARYTRQVCQGLLHIHNNNHMHLALRPQSILFETKRGDSVKIIDFGLAAKLDPEDRVKISYSEPDYAAPEVINGDSVGFSTDMWSIGLIVYMLLSGLHPFDNDVERIRACKWEFDHSAFRDISEEAKDFISKLILKDKSQRMPVHEALEHPWLKEFRGGAKAINTDNHARLLQGKWLEGEQSIGLGRLGNFGAHRKRRPLKTDFQMEMGIDRREAKPRFIKRPIDTCGMEDRDVNIQCQVTGSSPPVITWSKDGTELKQSLKFKQKYDNFNFGLQISSASLDDTGEYTVTATNSFGSVTHNVKVGIEPDPLKKRAKARAERKKTEITPVRPDSRPWFSFKLRSRIIQLGSSFKLSCIAAGYPEPRVSWFWNGELIPRVHPDFKQEYSYRLATLELDRATMDHGGRYACVCENINGSEETECVVKLQVRDVKRGQEEMYETRTRKRTKVYETEEEQADDAAAAIQKGFRDYKTRKSTDEYREEESTTTTSSSRRQKSSHYEESTGDVSKEDVSVQKSESHMAEKSEIIDGQATAELETSYSSMEGHKETIQEGDAPVQTTGEVSVASGEMQAEMELDLTDPNAQLHVTADQAESGGTFEILEGDEYKSVTSAPPGYLGPVVLVRPKTQTIDEGQAANFHCQLEDAAEKVSWILDDEDIQDGGRFKVWSEDADYYFSIPVALSIDTALYVFKARNANGECSTTFNLTITPSAEEAVEDIDVQALIDSVQ